MFLSSRLASRRCTGGLARRVICWGCARRSVRSVVDEQIVGRVCDLGRSLSEQVYVRQLQHLLCRQKALRPVLDLAILHEDHRGKAVDLGDEWTHMCHHIRRSTWGG